ncbi:NAD(P)H-dependent oxidoreductase [Cognatishimia sp. SS12]|uniref:FMN-dependent NADH-azoreductase n=1 Tax=Cognatishimia sp. SS12 TaxID=2979465 RepID=UPI00232BDF77|nr:NAD(P)H-dependent oxidoreductase [Cognatishimia sp. SS12]MDC0739263.1 NAD(P)H-dependent oxidoreductase [Cognatishimia sp. SS12]
MTHTVLHIDASPRSVDSVSRVHSSAIVQSLAPSDVLRRDLATPLPFLDETWVTATFVAPEQRTATQAKALETSDALVREVQAADTIVIGTPLYNFSLPAVLKAWIDQIARAGVTFAYTENGPKGLLTDKKVIIVIASGGVPIGSEADFASPYLTFALGFLGITDVTILDAEAAASFAQAA